ncbi:MAG: hypothetical protein ACRCW0_01335 [Clostridium sp.]
MKKIYCFIVIITTISYCSFISIYKKNMDIRGNYEVTIENNRTTNLEKLELNKKDEKECENIYNNEVEEKSASKKKEIRNKTIDVNEARKNKNQRPVYEGIEYSVDVEYLNLDEFDSYNRDIIKAEPVEMLQEISFNDKRTVLKLAYKVPKSEFNNIMECLNYKNERVGLTRVLEILEKYLSDEEMDEAKKIASPFIDVKKIEGF